MTRPITGAPGVKASSVAQVLLSNSTAETTLDTFTIPALTAKAGSIYRIRASGTIDNINPSGNLTFRLRIAGSAFAQWVLSSVTAVGTAVPWVLDDELAIRTAGAAGTWVADGRMIGRLGGTTTTFASVLSGTGINTLADLSLTLSAQWATADAGNVLRREISTFEKYR